MLIDMNEPKICTLKQVRQFNRKRFARGGTRMLGKNRNV